MVKWCLVKNRVSLLLHLGRPPNQKNTLHLLSKLIYYPSIIHLRFKQMAQHHRDTVITEQIHRHQNVRAMGFRLVK